MLIDSHCHLDFEQLQEDFEGVLSRAREHKIDLMLTISTRIKKMQQILTIAEAHDHIYCTCGTHPHNATEEKDVTLDELMAYVDHPKVVGLGEAGLDYHYDNADRDDQAKGFRMHIDAARRTGLPLVVHTRDAEEDTLSILKEETQKGAFPFLLHCFTASRWLAEEGVKLGGYVSFSGVLTFKKSDELRETAKALPLDRLLVETDAPYLAPAPMRGKVNEPSYVRHTAAVLGDLHGLSLEAIGAHTSENFYRLFSKVPPLSNSA